MKTRILITLFCVLSIAGVSQDSSKFEFIKNKEYNSYTVTPNFESGKIEGKKGQASFLNDNYVNNLLFTIIEDVLNKEKINLLHFGSQLLITINSQGEVLRCKFLIKDIDLKVLTEDDFYNLYIKFKQLKLDTSVVKILPIDFNDSNQLRYAEILCPLIPKNFKKNLNEK